MKMEPMFDERPTITVRPFIGKAEVVLIFDVSNLAHISLHAYRLSHNGKPTGHLYGSLSRVLSELQRHAGKRVSLVFCYDNYEGKPQRVVDMHPDYKGNRAPKDFHPVPEVRAMFDLLPALSVCVPGDEADQAIATYVHRIHENIPEIVVYSSDHDLWGLLKYPNVSIWRKQGNVTLEEVHEKYGGPKAVALTKAISGDPSDNIPKVVISRKGHGHKRVRELIQQVNGNPKKFIAYVKDHRGEEPFTTLWRSRKQIKTMYQVAKLHKDFPLDIRQTRYNRTALIKFLDVRNITKLKNSAFALFDAYEETLDE